MKVIKIMQVPDRKRKGIYVVDTENEVTHYLIGYIHHNEDLFVQALIDSKNITYIDARGDGEK